MTGQPVCCKPPMYAKGLSQQPGTLDIDVIMGDIREARRRGNSAQKNRGRTKRDLEEASSFKSSRAEQLRLVFCKQAKLRYKRLTDDEKNLDPEARKSQLVKSYVPQRARENSLASV